MPDNGEHESAGVEWERRGRTRATHDEWAQLDRLASLCQLAAANYDTFGRRTGWQPQPGCPYLREVEAAAGEKSPDGYTWSRADFEAAIGSTFVFFRVTTLHLLATADLLAGGHVLFSLAPTVRSIIEHLGRVAWALDPRCTVRQRLARSVAFHIEDLVQARKLVKFADAQRNIKSYTDDLRLLRRRTLPAMFWPEEIDRDVNGAATGACGQMLPGLAASVGYLSEIFDGHDDWNTDAVYNFLSASTHPTVQIYRMRVSRGDEVKEPIGRAAEPGMERMRLAVDLDEPRQLTWLAVRSFLYMWRTCADYYGLDTNASEMTALIGDLDSVGREI